MLSDAVGKNVAFNIDNNSPDLQPHIQPVTQTFKSNDVDAMMTMMVGVEE